jgi:hypothetical protein
MNSFKQFLEEGRDAPLYHALYDEYAVSAIKHNHLLAKSVHNIKLDIKQNRLNRFREAKVISLTRNLRFALRWAGGGRVDGEYKVIFELDQRKLTQNYKLISYNFFANYGKHPTRKGDNELGMDEYNFPKNQYEESIIGDVKNLNKYLTKIMFVDVSNVKKENEYMKILLKHPLAWDMKTKRFING